MPSSKLPYLKSGALEALSDHRWINGLSFDAYGVRVGVRTNAPELLDLVRRQLPLGWRPAASPGVERLYSLVVNPAGTRGASRYHLLYEDDVEISRAKKVEMLLATLESNLRLYVAEMTRRRVFVHAGVVGVGKQAIIIPARSMGGKSTLTAAFIRAGATYYSDEYAVLDSRGRVHPYPKPISIRNSKDYSQTDYPVEAFGGVAGTRPLPVGLVLLTSYKKGARWRPTSLSPGKSVLAILDHTVSARRHPDKAFETLRAVVSRARVMKGVRGEAGDVVEAVLKELNGV